MKQAKKNIICKFIEILIIILWLTTLKDSDSYFVPYVIVGTISAICCYNRKVFDFKSPKIINILFACLFTFFIASANYDLFSSLSITAIPELIFQFIGIIIGSFIVFYNIIVQTPLIIKKVQPFLISTKNNTLKPIFVFFLSFAIIATIYLLVFFICKYPGNLSFDSVSQIEQGLSGHYANRHPFFSTVFLMAFVNIGQALFNDINAGVATFIIVQILILSAIFAFSIMTLYQIKSSKFICIATLIIYAIMPYHIMYSMTVWKDVLFAGSILLFIISQYRVFHHIGTSWINYLFVFISALFACLYRGNGIYIIVASTLLFIALFWKQLFTKKHFQKTRMLNLGIMVFSIVIHLIFSSVTTSVFNIAKTEKMESLSIPAQQIARVIKDNNDLTKEQADLLSNVANLEEVPNKYISWLSDPMKDQVWLSKGGEAFLEEHKADFIKLYIDLGVSHPIQYYQAWADQTKGYYNGGYNHWVIVNEIIQNDLGIHRKNNNILNKLFDSYLNLFENNTFLRIVFCIGFVVWLSIWLLYITIIQKNKNNLFCIAIPLLLICTLLIAAPVFSELRYAYPVFCCLPFLSVVTIKQNAKPRRQIK